MNHPHGSSSSSSSSRNRPDHHHHGGVGGDGSSDSSDQDYYQYPPAASELSFSSSESSAASPMQMERIVAAHDEAAAAWTSKALVVGKTGQKSHGAAAAAALVESLHLRGDDGSNVAAPTTAAPAPVTSSSPPPKLQAVSNQSSPDSTYREDDDVVVSNDGAVPNNASDVFNDIPRINASRSSSTKSRDSKRNSSSPHNDAQTTPNLDNYLVGQMIGPKDLMEFVACPCCQQNLEDSHKKIHEPEVHGRTRSPLLQPPPQRRRGSLLDNDDDDESDDDDDDHGSQVSEDVLPGVLAAGVNYQPRRVLVEGWLHKKGTGNDFFGSRAWKARWARLALAKVDGHDLDQPVLMIYWYPSSMTVSTVICLDSTVVLGVDLVDKKQDHHPHERWNAHRFEIRHAATRDNATLPVTRTFTAPLKARDAWVYAISQALLEHAKAKAAHRQAQKLQQQQQLWEAAAAHGTLSLLSSQQQCRPVSPPEVWAGDYFMTIETRLPTSPPSSPPPPPSSRRYNPGSSSSSRKQHAHHQRPPQSPPTSPKLPRPQRRLSGPRTQPVANAAASQMLVAAATLLAPPALDQPMSSTSGAVVAAAAPASGHLV